MIDLDDELAQDYLAECREQLAAMEADFCTMQASGGKIDGEIVNRVFRAVHWVQGGAGVFDLVKIGELARLMENVLVPIRSHKMIPTPERVRLLLRATDRLRALIENPGASNQADSAEIMGALTGLYAEHRVPAAHAQRGPRRLRMLLVEDDFASRLLLQTFLSSYGECHVAVNGREASAGFSLRPGARAKIRPDLHGHHDAGDGRPRGGAADPRTGSRTWDSLHVRREDHHDHGRGRSEGSDPVLP